MPRGVEHLCALDLVAEACEDLCDGPHTECEEGADAENDTVADALVEENLVCAFGRHDCNILDGQR